MSKTSPRVLLAAGMAVIALAAPVAQEPGTARPAPQSDSRLASTYDLDHPYTFTPEFKTREEWLARREVLRRQVLVAVGLWPLPPRTPLAPVVHGRIDRDGYTIEKVFFASYPGHYVSGNLYRPTGASIKRPVVLSPHGHWENGRLLERPEKNARALMDQGAERTLEAARYPLQARCANLARLGFIVFQYDMVGYADSKPLIHREGFADAEAMLRLQSNMGLQTWNSLRALDFVTSLPDADPSRVAMTGESGGGTQTILLSAIDDRLTVSFPLVMVSGAMQGGCVCENAPLLRIGTNNIELAALFAPKPLGMSAANDWTKDLLTLGLPELKIIYGLFGAADRLTTVVMPFEHGDHIPSRERMYSWFSKFLEPAGAPAGAIVEPPFTPVPPAELSVFDAGHARPSDALDAPALRSYLTRVSDEQMKTLAGEPARYREVVSSALHAMINDPFASRVEAADATESDAGPRQAGGDIDVRRARLIRPGSGESVPIVTLAPRAWNNGVIVIWTHPAGQASVFAPGGKTAVPAVRSLLRRGVMVIAPDVTAGVPGDAAHPARLPHVKDEEKFPPYNYGYNRALLASRVRDLLTTVAFAKERQPREIHLMAFDRAGVWGLLARALSGDTIARASIDLDGFDFTDVRDPFDPMMLPGALKYGGIGGFLPVLSGRTELYRVSATVRGSDGWRHRPEGVIVRESPPRDDARVRWLLGAS